MKPYGDSRKKPQNHSLFLTVKAFRIKQIPQTSPLNHRQKDLLPCKMGCIEKLNIHAEHCHEEKPFPPAF